MTLGDDDYPYRHPMDCRCDSCRFEEGLLAEEECEVYEDGERIDND